jgi:hypothetical protein
MNVNCYIASRRQLQSTPISSAAHHESHPLVSDTHPICASRRPKRSRLRRLQWRCPTWRPCCVSPRLLSARLIVVYSLDPGGFSCLGEARDRRLNPRVWRAPVVVMVGVWRGLIGPYWGGDWALWTRYRFEWIRKMRSESDDSNLHRVTFRVMH